MKSTTYPYHVVLAPKQKRGQRTGKISTRDSSVIDSDLTYKFWNMDLRTVCSFRKTKQKCPTPFNHRARDRFTLAIFPLSLRVANSPGLPTLSLCVVGENKEWR
ncbi:hypothetical protein MTP99_013154 [Tenebrio molitor]|nr:hypothetical protein MTP99_013154 [Tenebrio molitor]